MKGKHLSVIKKTGRLYFLYYFMNMIYVMGLASVMDYAIDTLESERTGAAIGRLLCFILGFLFWGLLMIGVKKKLYAVREKEQFQMKIAMWKHIFESSRMCSSGEILENIQDDLSRLISYYSQRMPVIVCSLFSVLLYFLYSARFHWLSALILLGLSIIQIIPPILIKKVLTRQYLDCREIEGEITNTILDIYAGMEEEKVYGGIDWLTEILKEKHRAYKKIGTRSEVAYTQELMLSSFVMYIIRYGYMAILGYLLYKGFLDFSAAAALVVISTDFYQKVEAIFKELPEIAIDHIAIKRLEQWEPDAKKALQAAGDNQGVRGRADTDMEKSCTFQGLDFEFEEKKIFQNYSITLPLDKKVVLTGANGSGKTTLLKIIAGIYPVERGVLNSDYWENCIRENEILYLPQECPALNYSIGELVEEAYFEKFAAYVKEFRLHPDIVHKKLSEVSGGERKKLYLAYGFAVSKKLLLLDEPTNDLDMSGKETLMKLMAEDKGGIIAVSHEKELIDHADQIIPLRG